jgi:polyferredoxin
MHASATTLEILNSKRKGLMLLTGGFFAAVIAASLFVSPNFGYFLLACLALAMLIAPFLGRYWCNWLCPRGSFLESFLARFSRRKPFPPFFKRGYFLAAVVAVFMTMMGLNLLLLYGEHGLVSALGMTLTRLLVASTVVALMLGILYEPRAWCVFCPGGTFAKLAAGFKDKTPFLVNSGAACSSCRICAGSCPFHIEATKEGVVRDADCLKCFRCVEGCPSQALTFSNQP